MCHALFQMKKLPRHHLWIITTLWYSDYPRSNTNNRWHSIDAHIQDGTQSVSVVFWTWKAANSSFMNGCNQLSLRLHKMHSQKLLKLRCHSCSEWGSDRVVYCFAKKGCHYVGYRWQWPSQISITVLRRLKIVDTWLTLIFRMGQGACYYYFWHRR
jgi:hypothetical protein